MTDIHALKDEARATARTSTLTYCQALDVIARRLGQPNWKTLMRKSALVVPAPASTIVVSPDAARRSSEKINAWISRALADSSAKAIAGDSFGAACSDFA